MSFVIFDVETTGLRSRYDQILQFAAVRTDADLNVVDRIDLRMRLMPHIVPSPIALHINGADIDALVSDALPSHYEGVCEIAAKLRAWSPAVFLGYNSIRFDEEFLRQALFLCLHAPFLTNTDNNTRADVLNLMRAMAVLELGALMVPAEEGRPSFRLDAIARANGYQGAAAHDAVNDVEATLHLCRLAAERAPDLWSRFLRFAQRRVASDFVTDEDAFVYFDQIGASHSTHVVTDLGPSSARPTLHFCIDLRGDLDALAAMDDEALSEALSTEPCPIRRLRLNAAPLLIPLYEAPLELLGAKSEDDYRQRAQALRDNRELVSRLLAAAVAGERVYGDSPHVEEQIYSGGFPSDEEAARRQRFHDLDWSERFDHAARFDDARHRALAVRLLYLERPALLSASQRERMENAIRLRRRGEADGQPPCLTLREALAELEALRETVTDPDDLQRLQRLEAYLRTLL